MEPEFQRLVDAAAEVRATICGLILPEICWNLLSGLE
jgi:hypothetical protein